jgi:hypothetical protein
VLKYFSTNGLQSVIFSKKNINEDELVWLKKTMSNSGAASNKEENKLDDAADGVNASVGANNFDMNGSIDMSDKNLSPKSGTRTALIDHG